MLALGPGLLGNLPTDERIEYIPAKCAGTRADPATSVPTPISDPPNARSGASPLNPPGE